MNDITLVGSAALSGYVELVNTWKIHPSKRPLRSDVDSMELIASIAEKGLLEPIIVRPQPSGDGFEVVAGNRRLEACKKLKFRKVPCHVVELDDREAFEVSLTENLQRRTLNPIEEGEAFKKYVSEYGYGGASELAKKIGKSPTYVSRRIALLSLPDRLKGEVLRRRKTASVANEFLSLDEKGREELEGLIAEMNVTSRDGVRRLVKHLRSRGEDKSADNPSYYELEELKNRVIERALSKCVASLKESMARFNDAMSCLTDEDEKSWIILESLTWHRRLMNSQVDDLVRLRRRFTRHPGRTVRAESHSYRPRKSVRAKATM